MRKDHLEILLEDIKGKFDLVLEGHEMLRKEIRDTRDELRREIEHNSFLINTVNAKVDALTADLLSHRGDTEAHHGVYRVKEG